MKRLVLTLPLILSAVLAVAQQPENATSTTLTVSSTLVQVPVQVKTKSGKNVYELTSDNFLVTDNGIPQAITLDDDTGSQPLALAVVVQTGGAGRAHIADYQGLGAILDAIVGNVDHLVAVVAFDSAPQLLQPSKARARRSPTRSLREPATKLMVQTGTAATVTRRESLTSAAARSTASR